MSSSDIFKTLTISHDRENQGQLQPSITKWAEVSIT